MLDKYAEGFSSEGKVGVDDGYAHRINTGEARPISTRPRRFLLTKDG